MMNVEVILFWLTVLSYAVGFGLLLFGYVQQRPRLPRVGNRVLWLAVVFHTATVAARWVLSGHPPVTDTYELNLTGTWLTMLLFLTFARAGKADISLGLIVTPIVLLVLAYGCIIGSNIQPMGPAYRSVWLVVHVLFAWLGFGSFTIATGAAVLFLLKERHPDSARLKKVPDLVELDLAAYRYVVLGFVCHAMMLVAGAIWAKQLWGQYWNWDPLETWSLVAFLFYAFYLHLRRFMGWKMRRAAWLTVIGLTIIAISFWGVAWFAPSPHPGP